MPVSSSEGECISAHVSHANVPHGHTGAPLGYFYVHLYFHKTFVRVSLSLTLPHNMSQHYFTFNFEISDRQYRFPISISLSAPAQASWPGTEVEEANPCSLPSHVCTESLFPIVSRCHRLEV